MLSPKRLLKAVEAYFYHAPSKGSITLSFKAKAEHNRIIVTDTGIGIPGLSRRSRSAISEQTAVTAAVPASSSPFRYNLNLYFRRPAGGVGGDLNLHGDARTQFLDMTYQAYAASVG